MTRADRGMLGLDTFGCTSAISSELDGKVKWLIINMIGHLNSMGSTLAHVTLVSPTCVTGVTCVCLRCHLRVTLVSQSRVTDVTFASILVSVALLGAEL